jgi:hypothetical protein
MYPSRLIYACTGIALLITLPYDYEDLPRSNVYLFQEKIVYPKVALNKNNEWKYVVNTGEDYVQGVRVETCV